MKYKQFNMIAAIDAKNGIGKNGRIPWCLSSDLGHFKEITVNTESKFKSNVVIMGRKTWESIPDKFKPLEGRINIVLTKNQNLIFPSSVITAENLGAAFSSIEQQEDVIENVFIIGGQQLYEEGINMKECKFLYLTELIQNFDCDTFFPEFKNIFKRVSSSDYLEESMITYNFSTYERILID